MPRKTKEPENEQIEKETKKTTKKSTTAKKAPAKTTTKKATTSKKETSTEKKKTTTTKKASKTTSKATTEKKAAKTTTKKDTTTKKEASTEKKKTTTTRKRTKNEFALPIEYYDLPYRYNQTVVRVLAQTPKSLFIYWDISDEDRENYKKQFGENFFENTKPVLIVHNTTLDYSFEVEINDFANSWYLHINDAKCDYTIELGRRPIVKEQEKIIKSDYVYVASSNNIEVPNNKILFNQINNGKYSIFYKNLKTKSTRKKTISLAKNINKIYNLYNVYDLYNEAQIREDLENFSNPSSRFF